MVEPCTRAILYFMYRDTIFISMGGGNLLKVMKDFFSNLFVSFGKSKGNFAKRKKEVIIIFQSL